ncbi:hypothetical protein PF006_g33346, partial [Phytophthora fragariae]
KFGRPVKATVKAKQVLVVARKTAGEYRYKALVWPLLVLVVRQLRVHTRTNKADRIKCLRHYDRLVNSGERASSTSMQAAGNTRRTKHCMFRLINCLMSKDMINRLIEITGKNFDRQDLDDIQASQKAQFW